VKPFVSIIILVLPVTFFLAIAVALTDANVNSYVKVYPPEVPVVNIPLELRQANWVRGTPGNGSCTWASMISLLRWQEQYALANKILRTRSGGTWAREFDHYLLRLGVRCAYTKSGDIAFLERACITRRGAAVGVHPSRKVKNVPTHMIILIHIDDEMVCLLDSNSPRKHYWVDRDKFVREWQKAGGLAFAPLYSPAAPLP